MRFFGHVRIPTSPAVPDTIFCKKLTAASVETLDLPSGAHVMRVAFASSDAGNVAFINIGSTKANVPTTAFTTASTQGTTTFNIAIPNGDMRTYQVPTETTGFSFVSPSSGYLCIEFWRRGG